MARLCRVGQIHEVDVWMLMVDHTLQRWWHANLARKAISDIGMMSSV